jgi:hypothetical protein
MKRLFTLAVVLAGLAASGPAFAGPDEHPGHPPKPGKPVESPPASQPPDDAPGLHNGYARPPVEVPLVPPF